MASRADELNCACGAFSCTKAGYQQMNEAERRMWTGLVKSCQTCKQDRLNQGAPRHGKRQQS